MKTAGLGLVVVLLCIVVVIAGTLIRNQARLFQPPGLAERLTVYFTQHQAVTSDNHLFPELRTPVFFVEAETVFEAVLAAADHLGWSVEQSDDENLNARLVVTTPLLRFEDDVVVQVKLINTQIEGQGSALLVSASSRVGKADFAANAGHIQSLVAAVNHRLGPVPR